MRFKGAADQTGIRGIILREKNENLFFIGVLRGLGS
jgi:hypothetical protein